MNLRHFSNLDLLKSLAIANEAAGAAKVAAMITLGKQKFFGFNSMKSSPFHAKFGKNQHSIFLHAETAAIKNAIKTVRKVDLRHATLYVARVKRSGPNEQDQYIFGDSKPCIGCQKCITEFNIKKVFWMNDFGEIQSNV